MLNRVANWKEIREEIERDDVGKHDLTVPIEQLRMNEAGQLFNLELSRIPQPQSPNFSTGFRIARNTEALTLNDHALGQLFGRVGIPAQYGRKVMNAEPSMIADHVNYWIEADKLPNMESHRDREWLIRAKGTMGRAILTDKYTQLDNNFAFGALGSVLNEDDSVKLQGFMLDDRYLNARMTFPSMKVNLGTIQKPDWVFVGIHFRNSEVGCSSVAIDACLWRQVCTNGMIVRVKSKEGDDRFSSFLQQRHSRISQNELQNRVSDAISKAVNAGDGAIESFAKSREVKVKSPLDLIKELAKKEKYSQAFTDSVQNSFMSEPEETAYGVINAFTHAAQKLPIEQRLDVESFAGKFMQEQTK